MEKFLIHKTTDPLIGENKYCTSNPIPEGTEFEVQYEGQTLRFQVVNHWIVDETISTIALVGVGEPCAVKRPRLPRSQD